MKEGRGQLYTGFGAAAGMLASLIVGLLRQSGRLDWLDTRYFAATMLPPLLAVLGLWLFDRRRRLGSGLVVIAAGLMLGIAAVGSGAGPGLLWLPAGVLLVLGAHRLWTGRLTNDD